MTACVTLIMSFFLLRDLFLFDLFPDSRLLLHFIAKICDRNKNYLYKKKCKGIQFSMIESCVFRTIKVRAAINRPFG